MKYKLIITFLLMIYGVNHLLAQSRSINGRVLDSKNAPISGASVSETNNDKNGTTTDSNGDFQLTLKGTNNKITITSVGFVSQQLTYEAGKTLTVKMVADEKGLDDVVIVGFARQKRITSTGAVSSIKGDEIKSVPTASIQNTLVGRLPGFFSTQRSGQPGADAADFFIRGVNSLTGDNKPLIIVDDIEYDYSQLSQLNANEVESISILKDAATTSIYGLKGANGVLVVTTTRGRAGKPRINVTTEAGVNKIIRMPTFLDAYTVALLRNEATINDAYGLSTAPTLPYTQRDLQLFKDGSDPYGHPNVDWTSALLNKSSTQSRVNIDISGGNNVVKYFTSLGYYSQNGILKHFEPSLPQDDVNTNYFYKRYNFRSNLDITPTKTLKLRFDINGRFETINNPGGVIEGQGLFYELSAYRYLAPLAMPLVNPNGSYGYASHAGGNSNVNPISRLANGGYRRTFNNNFNIVTGAEQKLDFVTKGLSAKVNVSFAGNTNESRTNLRDLAGLPSYIYYSTTNSYALKPSGSYRLPTYTLGTSNSAFNSTTIIQASLNYDRTFYNMHHFTGLVLLNQRSYVNGGNIPINYRGTTGRLDYDFKRKYLLGFTLARNGNDLFQSSKRYGIFPAISWGWNLSEESFFKKAFPFFDLLKLRGSYGLVGSDASYPSVVNTQIQYGSGTNYYGNTTTEGGLVNPNITWEKEKKTDLGFEINMFNGKIAMSGSYFYNYRYDQLIDQGDVPITIGQSLPKRNIGISENKGFDGVITYKNKLGKLNYSFSANGSYAVNKVVYTSEAPDYPYQAKTGTRLNLTYAYHNIGFYQVDDFGPDGKLKKGIAGPTWSVIQPGDLKYQDFNGDGLINEADKTYISKPNVVPTTTYGVEMSLNYKGISLRALVQGAFGYAVQINAEGSGDAFNSNLRPWNLERWTPTTAATATYPRLGLNTNVNNQSYTTISDFWFADASYVRLKSLELAYQLPTSWLERTKVIQSARIYGAGYNLLNFNKMGHFQQDAEVSSGQGAAYPNTANFNLGLQVSF